jgi:hypothetical protein
VVTVFFRQKRNGSRTYLQIVENRRVDGKVRQHVLVTLGRTEDVREAGSLESLLASGARFSEKLMVLSTYRSGASETVRSRRIGPSLVVERLWSEVGMRQVLHELAGGRRFEFDAERAVFLTVLNRLFSPGSDRAADYWRSRYRIDGVDKIQLHHLYRAMAWLGSELPMSEQSGATRFSPRCVKDVVEERLFARRRSLFTSLDMVFFDTTSIYFEGEGGETLGRRGHNKDHRPDCKQLVVGAVLDEQGEPVCCEVWPGNSADVGSLVPVADRLQGRFGISDMCLVADRGMISRETLAELDARKLRYVLGARMRSSNEVRLKVLGRAGRYHEVRPAGVDSKAPAPLKVKEVEVEGRRYVVCVNEAQRAKDAADREAILASLEEQLRRGDKALVGNKGYQRFLKTSGARFEIDRAKAEEEARYDGKWVLRTNTELSATDVALKYKQLWTVEALFREVKSVLETRPIFHHTDQAITGHIFCSFLALMIMRALERRLESKGWPLEWARLVTDLDSLVETEVTQDGKTFLLRSEPMGDCGKVFQAVGVAMPPTVTQVQGDP